jgi:predicted Zn-ribbon and HTH transcriptional regulator
MQIRPVNLGRKEKFCKRCGHSWVSRSAVVPVVCPGCKSRHWDQEEVFQRVSVSCIKCGHSWLPHNPVHRPVACPGCQSRAWDGLHDGAGRLLPGAVVPVVVPVVLGAAVRSVLRTVPLNQVVPGGVRAVPAACFICGGAGCPSCKPVAVSCKHIKRSAVLI